MENVKVPVMLTLKEASKKFNLSYDFLRKLCLQNKIIYVRAGCKYFLNQDKLISYLNGEVNITDA